jgi:hypothetical protein
MDYQLDTNAAKKADVIFSKIDSKGKYLGVLTRAEKVTSQKGSVGVDLSFKAEGGESADYLTLWTHNKDGKQLMGFNTLMAIMTCLRVRELKAQDGEIEKYDNDKKARVKVVVPLFRELMDKPLGLLIHMEEYAKTAGGTAWKPVIAAAFDKDEFTASEILNKAVQPEALAKMVQALRDRPLKGAAPSATGTFNSEVPADFDDVPF